MKKLIPIMISGSLLASLLLAGCSTNSSPKEQLLLITKRTRHPQITLRHSDLKETAINKTADPACP